MKWITLLLTIFTIFAVLCSIAYSNGVTSEIVVFGDPSVYPKDAQDDTIPATTRVFNRATYSYIIRHYISLIEMFVITPRSEV